MLTGVWRPVAIAELCPAFFLPWMKKSMNTVQPSVSVGSASIGTEGQPYNAILYKGVEHLQSLVSAGAPETNPLQILMDACIQYLLWVYVPDQNLRHHLIWLLFLVLEGSTRGDVWMLNGMWHLDSFSALFKISIMSKDLGCVQWGVGAQEVQQLDHRRVPLRLTPSLGLSCLISEVSPY